jgi:hypothetical protein
VNVGWNTKGYSRPGDAEYFAVWREVRGRPSDLLQHSYHQLLLPLLLPPASTACVWCTHLSALAPFLQLLLPIGREFAPDLVIVAAGFDAAEGDPLGGCHVTPEGCAPPPPRLPTAATAAPLTAASAAPC